jgi:hypothetical protein
MKNLLMVKVAPELLAGFVLAFFLSLLASILLGSHLVGPISPVGAVIDRIAGAALLAFGIACWLARSATQNRATSGVVAALLFYDAAVVATFLLARFSAGLGGIALWPAIALHSALGISSVFAL